MKPQRMTTGVERVFRQTPDAGVYQEIMLHFIHFLDEDGNKTRSKLQQQIPGALFRVIQQGENYRSIHGEIEYKFPNGETKRMVALSMTYADTRYGRI